MARSRSFWFVCTAFCLLWAGPRPAAAERCLVSLRLIMPDRKAIVRYVPAPKQSVLWYWMDGFPGETAMVLQQGVREQTLLEPSTEEIDEQITTTFTPEYLSRLRARKPSIRQLLGSPQVFITTYRDGAAVSTEVFLPSDAAVDPELQPLVSLLQQTFSGPLEVLGDLYDESLMRWVVEQADRP